MFELSEQRISEIGMTWGLTFFIGFMLFIIWDLARKSKAGRFGTFVGIAADRPVIESGLERLALPAVNCGPQQQRHDAF